ncbi:hypothetical protein LB464_12695 [Escherichia coli]|nr:hypothetical protein [Escherichia coli]MCY0203261.1 hypothetical protein [Escherichia coli]
MIAREVQASRAKRQHSSSAPAGGIREIELSSFRVFQLIRGARTLRCSSARLLPTLAAMMSCNLLPEGDARLLARGLLCSCAGWQTCTAKYQRMNKDPDPAAGLNMNRAELAWGMHTMTGRTLSAQWRNHHGQRTAGV